MKRWVLCWGILLFFSISLFAENYTISDLFKYHEENSLALKIYQLRVKQAKSRINRDWSSILPKIDLALERTHNDLKGTRQLTSTIPLSESDTSDLTLKPINAHRARATLTQTLYDQNIPPKIRLSELDYQDNLINLEKTKNAERLQIVEAVYEILKMKEMVVVNEKQVEGLNRYLTEVQNKHVLKMKTKEDVLQVKVDLAKNRQTLIENKQSLKKLETDLKLLIGLPTHKALDIQLDRYFQVTYLDMSDPLGDIEEALRNRAEIKQLKIEKKINETKIELLRNRLMPTIHFSSSYGFTKENRFTKHESHRDWSWSVVGNVKFFNGFSSIHEEEELKAKNEELTLLLQLHQQQIESELTGFLFKLQLIQEQHKTSDTEIDFAKEHLASVKAKVGEGQATDMDVFVAEKDFLLAKINEIQTRASFKIAKATYYHGIGKDLSTFK
jgi:outer membrane protein TolC